jgi:nucleoside-diphosphate-sugar epimerase
MIALVTGGTGFVGSHLIEQLIAMGDEVRALVRPGRSRLSVDGPRVTAVSGDLDDAASLAAACRGVDVVYHSAALVDIVGHESEFARTTIEGTQRLVEAANSAGVKRFVYVSSCGVFHPGLLARGDVLDEATSTPEPPRWFLYGRAKHRAEQVVRTHAAPNCEWVIVRLGYLYGPGNRTMHTYLEPALQDKMMCIVGSGENEMAMVYVRDAVEALALAGHVRAAAHRVLIAGGNEHVTQRQYFDALADGFGIPRVKQRVPYWLAYASAWLGERVLKPTGVRAMMLNRSAVALSGLPQRLRCETTQRILGWQSRTRFADGMRKAFEWYRAEYGAGGGATSPVQPAGETVRA